MPIDGRVLGDQSVHVSHGDQDLHCPAAQILGQRKLVEIEGVVVVDRAPQQVTQVAHGTAFRGCGAAYAVELLQRHGIEIRLQPSIEHRFASNPLQLGPVVHVNHHESECTPRCAFRATADTQRLRSHRIPQGRGPRGVLDWPAMEFVWSTIRARGAGWAGPTPATRVCALARRGRIDSDGRVAGGVT